MRRWLLILAVIGAVLVVPFKMGCDCGWPHAQVWPSLWVATELRRWLCRIFTISGLIVVGAFLTAIIIWWQAGLLRAQNQLHALIELQREWNSERMTKLRVVWAQDESDIERLEPILEFLEDFARFRSDKLLTDEAVWDTTLGWHAALYYFYNQKNDNIGKLRTKWKDGTFFRNLEKLWPAYVQEEIKQRKLKSPLDLEEALLGIKKDFMTAERELLW